MNSSLRILWMRLGLMALIASTCLLGGCVVASVVGAAVSVTGAVVSTGVSVTGKVIGKTIDAVTPDSKKEEEKK